MRCLVARRIVLPIEKRVQSLAGVGVVQTWCVLVDGIGGFVAAIEMNQDFD